MARWSLDALACVLLLSFITIKQQNRLYPLHIYTHSTPTRFNMQTFYFNFILFDKFKYLNTPIHTNTNHLNLSTRIMVDRPRIVQHPQKVAQDKCLSGVRQGSQKLSTEYWQGKDSYQVQLIGLRIYKQYCWFIELGLISSTLLISSKFMQVFILNRSNYYLLKLLWIKSFFYFSRTIPLSTLPFYKPYLGVQLNCSSHHPYRAAIYFQQPFLSLQRRARITKQPIRLSFLLSMRQYYFERVPSTLRYLKGQSSDAYWQRDKDQGCYLFSYTFIDAHLAVDAKYFLVCQQQADTAEQVSPPMKTMYPHFLILFIILIIIMPIHQIHNHSNLTFTIMMKTNLTQQQTSNVIMLSASPPNSQPIPQAMLSIIS